MTIDSIPLIDLSPWTLPDQMTSPEDRLQVVQQVAQACREIGFFAVQNTGVDETVMLNAWTASRDFFDLPTETKFESKTDDEKVYPYGYDQSENLTLGKEFSISDNNATPTTTTTTTTTLAPADLKETFSIGPNNPDAGELPRRFPTQPAAFQPAMEKYYAAMEDLAQLLLRIFAIALELPPDWFRDKSDRHLSALRVLNYFAVSDNNHDNDNDNNNHDSDSDDKSSLVQREPGQLLRAGAHTDYGALTILKSGGPGLQVKKDVDVGGSENESEWVNVPDLPKSYIINLGDLMQQWTNGKCLS